MWESVKFKKSKEECLEGSVVPRHGYQSALTYLPTGRELKCIPTGWRVERFLVYSQGKGGIFVLFHFLSTHTGQVHLPLYQKSMSHLYFHKERKFGYPETDEPEEVLPYKE